MANVTIGGVAPAINPSDMTLVRSDKKQSYVETYSGVCYFSWGPSIVGKVIEIDWDFMKGSEFASLDTLFRNDVPVVFNPNDGLGLTFNVNILSLDGKYLRGLDNSTSSYRKDVRMKILIMSQV